MSVLIVTSVSDIVMYLHTNLCPLTTKNFLKLCKMKYYNGCLFHEVDKHFTAQTGDPTGTGTGGDLVYRFLYGECARFFVDKIHPDLKYSGMGTIAMANAGKNHNASKFYFTLHDDIVYLDEKHWKHTYILDDPFTERPRLAEYIPDKSPEGKPHDETVEE